MGGRRAAWLWSIALLACRGEAPVEEPAFEPPPPKTTSCAATHDAVGPACIPRFDLCGEGEVAVLGGGCKRVGVPKDGCAEGFTHDGKGACDAVLPKAACAPGTYARPGESECRAIDVCSAERFPKGATVFVDASYEGADADGSESKPYRRISDALEKSSSGAVVGVAAGVYAEDLVVDREVRVVGVCSSKVSIVGAATGPEGAAIVVRAKSAFEGLAIRGAGMGVIVDAASDVRLEGVRVHDTNGPGVWIRRGATGAVVRASLVERTVRYGVVVTGSQATLDRIVVRHVSSNAPVGVQANPSSVGTKNTIVRVVGSVIERVEGAGVCASGADIQLLGSVVRDVSADAGGAWGTGVIAEVFPETKRPGKVSIVQSVVERTRYFGVLAASSTMTLDRAVVRDTAPEAKSGKLGRGVGVQGVSAEATLVVRDSAIVRNHETGVDVVGAATATLERTIVARTAAIGATGSGVAALRYAKTLQAPTVTLAECALENNAIAGLFGDAKIAIRASRIAENGAYGAYVRGASLSIAASVLIGKSGSSTAHALRAVTDDVGRLAYSDVSLTDVLVRFASSGGVVLRDGRLVAERVAVRDVAPFDGKAGIGIALVVHRPAADTRAHLSDVLVERTHGAGIFVFGGRADLSRCVVRETRPFAGSYGDGLVVFGLTTPAEATVFPGIVHVEASAFERNARAGAAIFGSDVTVASTSFSCNAVDIDVEDVGAVGASGRLARPAKLIDGGDNSCGCATRVRCVAATTGIAPSPPEPIGE